MEVKVQIPFETLLTAVKQLSPAQKNRLQKVLTQEPAAVSSGKPSRLTKLLLKGPVFSKEQLKTIAETRKSINQWRTGS